MLDLLFIHVELVDNVIRGLKRGRAAGPDGVSAEHLHFSHPIICVLLSILFKLVLKYSYVPDAFGVGMIILLVLGRVVFYRPVCLPCSLILLFVN